MWDELKDCLPKDSAKQVSAAYYAQKLGRDLPQGAVILDLGCGTGVSLDLFRGAAPGSRWIGVDIEHSPEVDARTRADGEFRTYDGVNIPADDRSIDLIYSRQVFEHVRHPEPLLSDILRVLKPGGSFIGSTSHLEPYHSFSYWNFTPFGFKRLVEASGLQLVELRPGIDAIALITRAYRNNDATMNRWFGEESPLNQQIDEWARGNNQSVQQAALRKLSFCGQFCFWVRRPEGMDAQGA
ncbi:class I SAM-dependent methyltransferase [Lysobacter solisilvae (ex Woo and Kim 2022)]|nr:class I SAM-dependent methyltransferase [Lysobacter terrestris]